MNDILVTVLGQFLSNVAALATYCRLVLYCKSLLQYCLVFCLWLEYQAINNVLRALAYHQCGPGSTSRLGVKERKEKELY